MRLYPEARIIAALMFCVCGSVGFGQANDPVTVSYEPVWQGLGNLPVVPVQLEVNNVGKPEIVQIKWGTGQTEVSTFFDMPTGATKRRVIYMNTPAYYGSAEIRVRRGFIDVPISVELGTNTDYEATKVGIISDVVGLGSTFTRDRAKPNSQDQLNYVVGVAKPGSSPDRSVGYRGLEALFLGEGSERLSDGEVSAIKLAVLQGLNLIFVGGTISPVVNDSRWADLLPVFPSGEVRSVLPPKHYMTYGPAVAATPMLLAEAKSDAEVLRSGDVVVEAVRPLGMGSVTFLAFDPFHSTWKQWPGRFKWLETRSYYASDLPDDLTALDASIDFGLDEGGESGPSVDVFGIQMPSAGRITAVLIGYLILVVPVNFLILRRLKRGELAWITAPLIALGCAGILFAFAGRLYSAEASRYSSGYLLASDGVDEAVFVGNQQIFFPGTGSYDLGLTGVEYVGSGDIYADTGPFGQIQVQNKLVDMGAVAAPNYEVSNLSFRQLDLTQRLPLANGWVKSKRSADYKVIQGSITNPFPGEMTNVTVVAGKKSVDLGLIGVGSTQTFEVKGIERKTDVWIQASIGGEIIGSQYGKSVGQGSVHLHYSILGAGD